MSIYDDHEPWYLAVVLVTVVVLAAVVFIIIGSLFVT